jgi:predicted O-methyltransferase YrrM
MSMANKIVTTKTFKEVARHDWSSEADVCEYIGSLIKMIGAKNVLEIGVFEGETSIKMVEALSPGGKYTGIDINYYLKHEINLKDVGFELILGESIKVMQAMPPEQFDFIFVDGDHSWANILPEFKEVERVIKPGGIMAYHDTIHLVDPKRLMNFIKELGYNVITLNTSEGRGLSLIQKP